MDTSYHLCIISFLTLRVCGFSEVPHIYAILDGNENIQRDQTHSLVIHADVEYKLILLGKGFTNDTRAALTTTPGIRGEICEQYSEEKYLLTDLMQDEVESGAIKVDVNPLEEDKYYYLCMQNVGRDFIHQGSNALVRFRAEPEAVTLLPLWLQISFIAVLLCLSGLFSGLNLGLMALDKTELQLLRKCGTKKQQKYASVILPLRKNGNFLLCTLLIGNVLVNNTITILLDDISNGVIAVIGATAFIVCFGEIVPQAICSRHGLAIGANTRYITYVFMLVTFPVSFPISLILDKVLGEEIGHDFTREKLHEIIRVMKTKNVLHEHEVNIISGALSLTHKTVKDVMKDIDDAFMLEYNTYMLNRECISDIMKNGYSRIPVYDFERRNIVALLNVKDLALVNPYETTPLKTLCEFYQHRVMFVSEDMRLDKLLYDFIKGDSHLAIVRSVAGSQYIQPFKTVGVVTLEDVIEEIIQLDIIDETDFRGGKHHPKEDNFPSHKEPATFEIDKHLSPRLADVAFEFLSSYVEPFFEENITAAALRMLIRDSDVVELTSGIGIDTYMYIYDIGEQCDSFVLVLEGRVIVSLGTRGSQFYGGPLSYYGVEALSTSTGTDVKHSESLSSEFAGIYKPNFSIKPDGHVIFMKINAQRYFAARHSSTYEHQEPRFSKRNVPDEYFTHKVEEQRKHFSANNDQNVMWSANQRRLDHDRRITTDCLLNGNANSILPSREAEPVETSVSDIHTSSLVCIDIKGLRQDTGQSLDETTPLLV